MSYEESTQDERRYKEEKAKKESEAKKIYEEDIKL